jgi:phage terminase large subunit-like protein
VRAAAARSTEMWDLSCEDWEDRLREGRSLIPDLPLFKSEADFGLKFFDQLQLPDVPDTPLLGAPDFAAGDWFRDIVRATFGSWDPVNRVNYIRDIFTLAPKGSSKTSYSAALMLSVMLMNKRPNAEALFIGPMQSISDRAFDQAAGMIELSKDLQRRFRATAHNKTIVDLVNKSEMRVKTFDLKILTGSILIFVLLDELHLLGRDRHTSKVLRQVRGGLDKTPEGKLLITTTQSDDIPAGAFSDELIMARKIRDGKFRGKIIRPMLPILYEFPKEIAKEQALWENPENWPMVMPNLERSVHLHDLVPSWESEKTKGKQAINVWASQHLNVEIGIGLMTDGWPGAEFWLEAQDDTITLDTLIERCEVIVVGVDGGGLDDLFGLTVLGREPAEIEVEESVKQDGQVTKVKRKTKRWLSWSHAWCHKGVLERRKAIAAELESFAADKELTIVDDKLDDVTEIVAIIEKINVAGLLACVAIDAEGPYGEFVDALAEIQITEENEQIVGIGQGYKLMNAIKTTERKLANGTLVHASSRLMNWCVKNVKIEPTATAIRATKQNAGDLKIDPWCALQDAATVMVKNPEAGRSVYDAEDFDEVMKPDAEDAPLTADEMQILSDPRHPRWQELRERYNAQLAAKDTEDEGVF